MEIANVRGEKRTPGGRHANERLRRQGLVPAVIYGHKLPPETAAVSRHDLELALEHLRHVVQVELGGAAGQYLIKDVQYDYLGKELLHVDLMRVSLDERVRVKVAVELKGEPKGMHEGGELVQVITDLELECPLNEIPERLTHNVKELDLGQAVHIRDIALPPNVKALQGPDEIIAIVRTKRGVTAEEVAAPVVAEGAATSAEPEVIAKGKEETDEGGQ